MAKENLIHIRVDYNEAFDSKRSLLSMQMNLLKLLKIGESYKLLRKKEFILKEKLNKKMKELKINVNKIQKTLPKAKIPKSLRKDSPDSSEKGHTKDPDRGIEDQLLQIQSRLDKLQRESLELT